MSSNRARQSGQRPRVGSGWTLQHRPQTARRRAEAGYSGAAQRPLAILIFLLPLIIAYEVGSRLYLNSAETASVQTIRAHSVILAFFQDFGIVGRFLPAIALMTVLVVWHVLNSDRWRVRLTVLLGMAAESIALTLPLLVFIALIQLAFGAGGTGSGAAQVDPGDPLAKLPWRAGVAISIGAGLYEELLFRLIGVSALHLILVDLARFSDRVGTALAVGIAAAGFAAYHDVVSGGQVDAVRAISLLAAGGYFGAVFALRGFGVAVGVHIVYDVCVLVLFKAPGS